MDQFIIFCKLLSLHIKLYSICQKQQSATNALFHLVLPNVFLLVILNGCASYKVPTESFAMSSTCYENICSEETEIQQNIALDHWLYHIVPRHRSQIKWYDIGHTTTWMLFGNDDDGIFGEGPCAHFYPTQRPSLSKAVAWGVRNPLHNFCFYVIGSADRQNSEIDFLRVTPTKISGIDYKPQGDTVFVDDCSSFYFGLHGGKPFLSLRLVYFQNYRFDFYIGWRCRGNFGIKFLPFKKVKDETYDPLSYHF